VLCPPKHAGAKRKSITAKKHSRAVRKNLTRAPHAIFLAAQTRAKHIPEVAPPRSVEPRIGAQRLCENPKQRRMQRSAFCASVASFSAVTHKTGQHLRSLATTRHQTTDD
jgi:hypothetical protein